MSGLPIGGGMDRRRFLGGVALGAAGIAVAACGGGSSSQGSSSGAMQSVAPKIDGDLNILNWSDYMDPGLIKSFEDAHGVKITVANFAGQDELVAKLASKAPFDLAIAGSHSVPKLAQSDLLLPFDHDKLENWGTVLPFFEDPPYDPGAKFSVPYDVGSNGLAWRADKVDGAFTGSWNDLWEHPEAAKHTYVFDALQMGLGMSLVRLGYSVNSDSPDEVGKAADALIELKPRLAGFSSDDLTNLTNGQAWLTQAYTGSTYQALNKVDDPSTIGFQSCREGQLFNADNMVIPAAAQSPGTALMFIDWILRPENAATNVNYIGYPMPTQAGMEAFANLVTDYPFLASDEKMMSTPDMWLQSLEGDRLALWSREWSRVKAA